MEDRIRRVRPDQIQAAVDWMNRAEGLPFREVLACERLAEALTAVGVRFRKRVFDPVTTLWGFLSQVFSADGSCQEAVDRVNAQRVADGLPAASSDTSSYCQARLRLPEAVVTELARRSGRELDDEADPAWRWHGWRVRIVDGTTVSLPDTPENQRDFPQPSSQPPGLGFPQARLLVVFSLAVGTVLEAVLGRCEGKHTGENSLFRGILNRFEPGDLILADRNFDAYRDIATLQARGVDVLFRMSPTRDCDFRRGRRLGRRDHLVVWHKPQFDRQRFDRAAYAALPETLVMRELQFRVRQRGFRTKEVRLVTTLLDSVAFPKHELTALYRERWHCELDLRSLKPVLGLGRLRCQTPEMVRKELWMHLLGYNLIRQQMARAARLHHRLPRRLSFKGAVQVLNTYLPKLATNDSHRRLQIQAALCQAIAHKRVGERPNRCEPRAIKRRKSKYKYLTTPRLLFRKQLLNT